MDEPSLQDSCGVFGCVLADEAQLSAGLTVIAGLESLQHRGSESSGVVGCDGIHDHFEITKGMGLVRDVFNNENLRKFEGCRMAVGHNRYSTAGVKDAINCVQPFVVHTLAGLVAIAHNGQIVNAPSKRLEILRKGVGLSTDTDSELLAQLIASGAGQRRKSGPMNPDGILLDEIRSMMKEVTLSYSLVIMSRSRLYAVRDPWANRPLCIGHIKQDGKPIAWLASSESCALFRVNASLIREVLPGEIVELSSAGILSHGCVTHPEQKMLAFCIFEYVYFARPDSKIQGHQVEAVRRRSGRILARESPVDADIVTLVPESAFAAAQGYSQETGIPFGSVLCKNSYVGRSFIQPDTKSRQKEIRRKFGPLQDNILGKRIVLVDDSIVRGNTMTAMVALLKEQGAAAVHIRVASPPIRHACYMGINIPRADELLAHKMDSTDICEMLGADSVQYLSVQGLLEACNGNQVGNGDQASNTGYCTACLTNEYPVEPEESLQW